MKSSIIIPLKPQFGNEEHIRADKSRQAELSREIQLNKLAELQWSITQWEKDYNETQNNLRET